MRKHLQQLSQTEKAFVHGFVRQNAAKVLNTDGAKHFYDRVTERHFTIEDAVDAMRGGLVIEIHNDRNPDVRVLVRNAAGTCVVVSMVTWQVITVYYNNPEDKHETLNWNAYRWQVDVVVLVKQLRTVSV